MTIPYYIPGNVYTSTEDPATTMRVEEVDEDDYVLVTYLTVGPFVEGLTANSQGFLTQFAFDNPEQYWTPTP
jgi:hypothetical protein